MTYSWGTDRRINLASGFLKKEFGTRIQKVAIDAGFTCPNRDGTLSTGGCAFCNNEAFNPGYCSPDKSVTSQIEEGISFHRKRYKGASKFLAYFQAYSNTYAALDHLKELYAEALAVPGITGLIIGTRPDCVDESLLAYLSELAENCYVVVEYGIESVYNETLLYINRGHTFEQAVDALNLTAKYGLRAGGHFIFGLPGESIAQMMESVQIISGLPLHSVKFHQLQIIRGTRFEEEYRMDPGRFPLFGADEYKHFISHYLSGLNPDFVVDRIAGETQPGKNLGKVWNLRYDRFLQNVEDYMEENNLWQGKNFVNSPKLKPQ